MFRQKTVVPAVEQIFQVFSSRALVFFLMDHSQEKPSRCITAPPYVESRTLFSKSRKQTSHRTVNEKNNNTRPNGHRCILNIKRRIQLLKCELN